MSKRNFYISYIKGYAIIGVLLIHLIDWSNIVVTPNIKFWRELLYPAVLFFISTVGSVIYIAYAHRDNLKKTTWRLIMRGGQLIGIYFLYNLIKLWIYDFDKSPFYWQFTEKGIFDVKNIFLLHSFSVPITIILTIGAFLIISPLFLWIAKRARYPKIIIGAILTATLTLNYIIPLPQNIVTDFLYSRNIVMFPLALWFVPYLIGFYLALLGFEKYKGKMFLLFAILTGVFYYFAQASGGSWRLSEYMYPLRLYYICASFAFMYALIWLFWGIERLLSVILRRSRRIPLIDNTKGSFASLRMTIVSQILTFAGMTLRSFLALIRFLGDHTLAIYIYHWIVIDLAIWYYYPDVKKIWIWGPILVLIYLIIKRKKLLEYYKEYSAD
ncbi:MAG: hypothetical protein WCX97_03950 [Candidatus Magasanikbacteria bacterium]